MKTPWIVSVVAPFGAVLLGLTAIGCSKTRVVTQFLQPQPKGVVVSGVTMEVDPARYQGQCPGVFTFSAVVTVSDSSAVIYRWERSDGYVGPPGFLWFEKPGSRSVATTWSPSAPGSYWQWLHVLNPDDIVSDRVAISNNCVQLSASATVRVSPAAFDGPCPGRFDFHGDISANGAGLVRYRWEGSDGQTGPEQDLWFNDAGTQTVLYSRSLLAAVSLTERLHILAPRDTLSAAASFTNACQGIAVEVSAYGAPAGDPCQGIYDFIGQITTNASAVTYQWERSDGFITPVETLNFEAPGTKSVTNTWQPETDTAWARLHVLGPVDVTTERATVEYGCCWVCDSGARARALGAQLLRQARP